MTEREKRERYEEAGKRSLLVLARCKRLFKGDGLYVAAKVVLSNADSPISVGWDPSEGFWVEMGDGDMVIINNPLDAPRLAASLSAMGDLYAEAKRLRDSHAALLNEGSDAAERFLAEATATRKPPKEPPAWNH